MNKKVVIIVIVVLLLIVVIGVVVATSAPTAAPTSSPTSAPTSAPTAAPTSSPTSAPTTEAPVPTTTGGGITFVQITRSSMNPGWYPYGATANFVKSTIGVTNLESAISYARANGYSAFSFNESSTSTDPNDNNSKILFFNESDINTSTFFTSGASLPGFKVYAARDSKLNSTETFSFNLPQYLRHLQNKNFLL